MGGTLSLSSLIGVAALPLVKEDPQRYGSLHHPGDDYAYDIYTQAARGRSVTPAPSTRSAGSPLRASSATANRSPPSAWSPT